MLPTSSLVRSYCFIFSGAFMALVYSPDSFCEIGVVGRKLPRHFRPQKGNLRLGRRRADLRGRRIELKAGEIAALRLGSFVDRLQAEAPALRLPAEQRLAGEERRRAPHRGHEL